MTAEYILFSSPFAIEFSALDETEELLEECASFLNLRTSDGNADIKVYLVSTDGDPSTKGLIRERWVPDNRWKTYTIRDWVTIRESPDRTTYICCIPFLSDDRTALRKWILLSMVFNEILAILSDRILLIHGALLVNGERGYVLTGRGGIGKSTAAARVPPPWQAEADDMIAVMATPEGYVAYPLPTWSQLYEDPARHRGGDMNLHHPLSGIYLLEQSATDEVRGLRAVDAITRLYQNSITLYQRFLLFASGDDRLRCRQDVFMHARRLLDRTPCAVLRLSLDGRFWELLPPDNTAGPVR